MLLEFRFANFGCFADEQQFSLMASSDRSLPSNVVTTGGRSSLSVLRGAMIYGPNGGGKSTLVRALATLQAMVRESASDLPDALLPVVPFKLSPGHAGSPTRFVITFLHEGVRYEYGVEATRERVAEEWLFAWPGGRVQRWFHRHGQTFEFGPALKGQKTYLSRFVRENCLFLSMGAVHNQEQLREVYDWFAEELVVLEARGGELAEHIVNGAFAMVGQLRALHEVATRDELRERVTQMLRAADVGIVGLRLERHPWRSSDLPLAGQDMREMLKQLQVQDILPVEVFTRHPGRDGSEVELKLSEESLGTQQIFFLATWLLDALDGDKTLVLDEVFPHLHPTLVRGLMEQCYAAQGQAQLIFTAHDTSLLDKTLVRRDQIWLAEKGPAGEAGLVSIAEYSPRKDEALARAYLTGRYGGIPVVGDFGMGHA